MHPQSLDRCNRTDVLRRSFDAAAIIHRARLGLGRGDRATFARGARVRCCIVGRVDARGSLQSRIARANCCRRPKRLRSEFGAEPLTRPLGSSGGTPLLRSPRIQPWGFPRPRPNLPLGLPTVGRGSRLRDEAAEKFSGAAMAAIGQKGLPVIDWNVRLYAGIDLCWLYFCKREGR